MKTYNIQPSDNGQYWCHFQEGNYCGEANLLLNVAGEYLGKDKGSQTEKYIKSW